MNKYKINESVDSTIILDYIKNNSINTYQNDMYGDTYLIYTSRSGFKARKSGNEINIFDKNGFDFELNLDTINYVTINDSNILSITLVNNQEISLL